MTQEEKQLLLKYLCAVLPYGVICKTEKGDGYLCSINQTIFGTEYGININPLKRDYFSDNETEEQFIKPYLRSMSSMTEKDMDNLNRYVGGDRFIFENGVISVVQNFYQEGHLYSDHEDYVDIIDWLNEHHFDYRGLIEKGLAFEAPEGMYKTE